MEDIFGITIIIILIIMLILMSYNWSSVKKNCPNCEVNCEKNCTSTCTTCNKPKTCVK